MRKVVAIVLLLTACGGGAPEGAVPDGEELFNLPVLEQQAGCITCHSLAPDRVLVGPSLSGIGTTAGTRVAGVSADAYLRQSITEPDAFVVEGFDAGRMPAWGEVLSDAEVEALVGYLSGLAS